MVAFVGPHLIVCRLAAERSRKDDRGEKLIHANYGQTSQAWVSVQANPNRTRPGTWPPRSRRQNILWTGYSRSSITVTNINKSDPLGGIPHRLATTLQRVAFNGYAGLQFARGEEVLVIPRLKRVSGCQLVMMGGIGCSEILQARDTRLPFGYQVVWQFTTPRTNGKPAAAPTSPPTPVRMRRLYSFRGHPTPSSLKEATTDGCL